MFVKVVILLVGLSTAYSLRCYSCEGKGCRTDAVDCSVLGPSFDRCASAVVDGNMLKSCLKQELCVASISCCSTDLCNGAVPTGPAVALLLLSSAIFTLFL